MDHLPVILFGAALAGFVQGLSGFGFSLTAMSVWAWVLDPKLAAALAVFGALTGHVFTAVTVRRGFDWKRLLPFLAGGVAGSAVRNGGGSDVAIDEISKTWLLPSNARLPVIISCSTAPNAKISVRASASSPSNCSGAMYCNVPISNPGTVNGVVGIALGRGEPDPDVR